MGAMPKPGTTPIRGITPADRLSELQEALMGAIHGVADDELQPHAANAIAALAKEMCKALTLRLEAGE